MSDGTFFALAVVFGEESSNFDILSDVLISLDEKRESLLVECGSLVGSAPRRSILPMVGGMLAVALLVVGLLVGEACVATNVERLRSCRFIYLFAGGGGIAG